MLTSSGYGAISPLAPKKQVYRTTLERESRVKAVASHNSYDSSENHDSVTFSSVPTKESRFRMDMASRLTQAVRTTNSTGDIRALQQEVASGQYQVDPMAVAARILFLGEGG